MRAELISFSRRTGWLALTQLGGRGGGRQCVGSENAFRGSALGVQHLGAYIGAVGPFDGVETDVNGTKHVRVAESSEYSRVY